jgi:hypothetical protein
MLVMIVPHFCGESRLPLWIFIPIDPQTVKLEGPARHSEGHDRGGYVAVRANTGERTFWADDIQDPAI